VLAALEPLVGEELTLADLHLGAMVAYFVLAPEGATLLRHYPS
jgi:glutathione S-transferase